MVGVSVSENENLKSPNKLPSWIFVGIQGIFLLLLLFTNFDLGWNVRRLTWFGTIFEWLGIIGILASASSLRGSLTPMPLPKVGGKMTSKGLYRYVRHPMYTSVLLFALGIASYYGDLYKYILVGSLCVLFFFKSSYEEKFLVKTYPGYAEYAKVTPRFIPTFKRSKSL